MAQDATEAILGPNPFIGFSFRQLLGVTARWMGGVSVQPGLLLREGGRVGRELGRIAGGRSQVVPSKGDRRFSDSAWSENPLYRRLMQTYLVLAETVHQLIDEAGLDELKAERAHFAAAILTDTLAPTNAVLSNPAAVKRAFDTAGTSLFQGAAHLLDDIRHNGGMPAMVDRRPFKVGGNLAVTPGAVVHREDVFELIQYTPVTERTCQRPLVLIPPQINKYYAVDLAPGRSLTEFAVAQGIPFFTMSWRNPTSAQRDWDLDTYVRACVSAIEVAHEITGSDSVNVAGLCAGGVTMSLVLGHLAAIQSRVVNSATFVVCMLDTQARSMMSLFSSRASIALARANSQRKGVLDGGSMAKVFAWLRPNDLIWNYWVNNYLLGKDPAAFDILFWNADTTRLPAGLHGGFLDLFETNPLVAEGGISVLGTPVALRQVTAPAYVVGAVTDHIVPWQAAYQTTQMLGGQSQFVLSSSGHVQSIVNPPGNPKMSYYVDGPVGEDPRAWRDGATEVRGTWWEHWVSWLAGLSGPMRPAPRHPGSDTHPVLEEAPGRYVFEK